MRECESVGEGVRECMSMSECVREGHRFRGVDMHDVRVERGVELPPFLLVLVLQLCRRTVRGSGFRGWGLGFGN